MRTLAIWSLLAASLAACEFGTCHACLQAKQVIHAPIVKHNVVKEHVYPVQQVIKKELIQVDSPDVYVVQNAYPQPLVGQGSTGYRSLGYQQGVLPLLDPNRYFNQELQLIQAADKLQSQRTGRTADLFQRLAELQAPTVERLAAGQAAQMVLQAAGLDPGHNVQGSSQAVVITRDSHGQTQVIPLTQPDVASLRTRITQTQSTVTQPIAARQQPVQANGDYPLYAKFCSQCHDVSVAQPKGDFHLGKGVEESMVGRWFEITRQIKSGAMPPADHKAQPSAEERLALIDELEGMVSAATE